MLKRALQVERKIGNTLVLLVIVISLTARFLPGPRTIDDAYITYRYARNLLAGEGFVYNSGEHVLGTTTPLYTLILASLGAFLGGPDAPFPAIALTINALADAATCLLLFRMGRQYKASWAGFAAALTWGIAPFSVTFAIGGLETSLYVFLLAAASWAYLKRRYQGAAVACALALLTRPDALLLIAPLMFARLVSLYAAHSNPSADKAAGAVKSTFKAAIAEIAAFTLPVSAWFIFAAIYFGSPIPHSITAKTLAYRLPGDAAFTRLLQHYAVPFMGENTFGIPWIAAGLFIYPFLYLIGLRRAWRSARASWPIFLYPVFYFLVFSVANPLIFRWYLTPPLPFYMLFILIGLESLVTDIIQAIRGKFPKLRTHRSLVTHAVLFFLVIAAPFTLSLNAWSLHPDHGLSGPAPEMAWYQLELLYRQAAETITSDLAPLDHTPLLAAGDVGVLGYYTRAGILDTVGLNSPVAVNYYPLDPDYYVINYAIPPDLIIDHQPDYVVFLEVYGRAGLLKDQRFLERYALLQKIPTDIYGSDGMLIYSRR